MSGAARAEDPAPAADDLSGAGEPLLRPGIRAYAALPSGVHGIPIQQAVEQLHSPADQDAASLLWIDVVGPGETEAAFLRDEIGLHPLAVEDCVRGRQRPKLERFPDYLFVVFYAAHINPERGRVALNEIHLFLSTRFIITVHDHRIDEVRELLARWRSTPGFFPDVGAIAHALLDALVDDYFPVLNHFAERTAALESAIFDTFDEGNLQQIFALRRELVLFRRMVGPQREVLSTLLRRDLAVLRPELFPYFQDVHDHLLRVTEEIDAIRELLSAALEAQLSVASNQLNQTMRMMTAWSIILMSLALVAGVYGMNFANMPELQLRWGYFLVLAAMGGLGLGLLAFFRRRHWL